MGLQCRKALNLEVPGNVNMVTTRGNLIDLCNSNLQPLRMPHAQQTSNQADGVIDFCWSYQICKEIAKLTPPLVQILLEVHPLSLHH